MPDCSYCDASFDDEESLLRHMSDAHEGELGRVDRRRVEDVDDGDGGGLPTGPIVLVGVIGIAVALVAYVIVFVGGSSGAAGEPGTYGSAHAHGTMEMTVLGEQVDFSRPEYQVVADRFHFEEGNGRIWHTHATDVTLGWAMGTLDINVTSDSVTFDGTTYRDSDPQYNVTVAVNGESVDPSTYVLEGTEVSQADQGDHVLIEVRQTNETG